MVATKITDEGEARRWFKEGRSLRWMRDQYLKRGIKTSISMWGNFRSRQGLDRRTVQDDDLIPWRLEEDHRFDYPALMLRAEARRRAGKDVRPEDLGRVRGFLKKLHDKNEVVDYSPEKGFSTVPREPGDTDIVRSPTHATGKRLAVD
jgi:hypothetical protein